MGQIRIIGGVWKRSVLRVVDRPGLRPTPDRVRETLFNWIDAWAQTPLVQSRVCDVFAGTGALAFEAASRGAQAVIALETDALAAKEIAQTIERLAVTNLRLVKADGLSFLDRQPANSFDLVLLDPPFGQGLLARGLAAAQNALTPTGLVHVEGERPWRNLLTDEQQQGWQEVRSAKAGAVHHALLSLEPN
jgi:16S rRNA (guanine966-N2)-methyltransferase